MTPQDLIALAELADSAHVDPEDMRNRLILANLIEVRGETVHLTERGRAHLANLLAVPFPEPQQVTVWRVPQFAGIKLVPDPTVPRDEFHVASWDTQGNPEPPWVVRPAPRPTPTPKTPPQPDIPTDPETLRVIVRQLTDNGLGQAEIATRLKITEAQVDAYFHGR